MQLSTFRLQMRGNRSNPDLIQLGRRSGGNEELPRASLSLIEKFFVFGAVSGLIGGVVLGAHLWLMLNGEMRISVRFAMLRKAHALVQTYLFFGLFILGFLFQTAPKIMKVRTNTSPWFLASIPFILAGIILQVNTPASTVGPVLIAAPFFATALLLVDLMRRGTPLFRESYAYWVILSLLGLTVSPFFPVTDPANAEIFLWSGVIPVTFAAGQQFIFAFLGGARLEARRNRILLVHYALTLVVLFMARSGENANLWRASGVMCFLAVLGFMVWTKSTGAFRRMLSDPLAFGFASGFVWALVASATTAVFGSTLLDSSVHLLTLGWLTPLIIAVSSQVLRAIAGRFLLRPRPVLSLLLIWQLVPIGRGLRSLAPLSGAFSLVVISAATIVLVPWLLAVALSALQILRKRPVAA
ncbi:MAG: NnrS family protein [Bdellovibrionota bacterium]